MPCKSMGMAGVAMPGEDHLVVVNQWTAVASWLLVSLVLAREESSQSSLQT